MGVHAAFVSERGDADPRLARVGLEVRDLIHEMRQLAQFRQRRFRHRAAAHFQSERGNDADQIAIAGAFAVAIDRALHLRCADVHRGDGIGDAEAAIVVRVNADARGQFGFGNCGDAADLRRQTTAVGIAQHDAFGAGLVGERVFRFVLVTVKGMFRVVNHRLAMAFEKFHGVRDHREVFVRRGAEHLSDVKQPGFADDGDDGRFGFEHLPHQFVFVDRHAFATGHAERSELRVFEFASARLLKKCHVARI